MRKEYAVELRMFEVGEQRCAVHASSVREVLRDAARPITRPQDVDRTQIVAGLARGARPSQQLPSGVARRA